MESIHFSNWAYSELQHGRLLMWNVGNIVPRIHLNKASHPDLLKPDAFKFFKAVSQTQIYLQQPAIAFHFDDMVTANLPLTGSK